jgi:hypothetical protein
MAQIPRNIFSILKPCAEEEEAPPLWVERDGATTEGGEVVR